MNYYGNNNYRPKYNENKYSSSLSNVYNDLMLSNKKSYDFSPNGLNRSSSNIKLNYHFLNRNSGSNDNLYKSNSPPPVDIPSKYKNFYDNGADKFNNMNKSSNNIFSHRNNNYNYNLENQNNYKNESEPNLNKKNFYDTLANFGRKDNNYMNNPLYNNNNNYEKEREKEIIKPNYRNNDKIGFAENKNDLIYKNFFNNSNERMNQNLNKYRNNSEDRNLYSMRRSPDKNNLLKMNSVENYKYIAPQKDFYDKDKFFNNKMNRGYSLENLHNRNYNNANYPSKNFKVVDYGYHTMAGTNAYYIQKTNQDSYLIKADKITSGEIEYTFGVFDGHGLQGHFVSQAIKQFFMNCSYFDFDTQPMILSTFASLSSTINNSKYFDSIDSGSTVILIHITQNKIISINCGDSRAILITKRNSNYLNKRNNNIIELSRDHKPDIPEEKMRIEKSGGRVDKIYGMGPYRVWFKNEDYPGLAMSRSIGDRLAHRVGVSDIPEIKEFSIEEVTPYAIVLASDGVWEFMSNEEVRDIVYRFENNRDGSVCAKKIVERARMVWEKTGYAIDDITCVVVFFKEI
jgi:serine/threonine protein phosphatase PrpC